MSCLIKNLLVIILIISKTSSLYEDQAERVTYLCQDKSCDDIQDLESDSDDIQKLYNHKSSISGEDFHHIHQTGVWIYYSEPNYEGDQITVVFGTETSYDIGYPVKSVRYAGNSQGLSSPSLTLYTGQWFTGTEYFIELGEDEEDVMIPYLRDFTNKTESLIVTGTEFAIFPGTAFFGPGCTCLGATHFNGGGGGIELYTAGFFPLLQMTELPYIGSVCGFCPEPCKPIPDGFLTSVCPILSNTNPNPCNSN